MIFPLSCPESLRVITAQTLPKVTISNDQALGPQFNAPGVYIKINNFDLAFFQGQCLILIKYSVLHCTYLWLVLNCFTSVMIVLAPMVFHHLADS